MVLRSMIVAGAEYVDLMRTSPIRSAATGDETDHQLPRLRPDARQPGGDSRPAAEARSDVVKIVTTANSPQDNVRMLQLVADADPHGRFLHGGIRYPAGS
jgi:hypothetical protein